MKKIVFIIALATSLLSWGQEKPKPTFWERSQVGVEFLHYENSYYELGDHGLLRNNPFNSIQFNYSFDMGKYWTLTAYYGFCTSHIDTEYWGTHDTPSIPNGESSRCTIRKYLMNRFGVDGSFHLLKAIHGKDNNPFDLSLNAFLGYTTRDAEGGIGFSIGYRPIPQLEIYGKVDWGIMGYRRLPLGNDISIPQGKLIQHVLRCGVSYRL